MTDGEAIELVKDAGVYADARWIPCRERLLEASSRYLLLIKNDYERRYSKTAWFKGDVTARRSFSEAYMGEENMSLDEAIKYYSHLADENRRKADIERNDYMDLKDLTVECEQLADWLNELKILREKVRTLLEKQEQDSNKCCETCKYKNRSSQETPCCDCYFATYYEDCYEAEEDNGTD